MAKDNETTAPTADKTASSADAKTGDVVTVNLHNPTTARRIIHDGIEGSQRAISIEAGQTKHQVKLHRAIADELRGRTRRDRNADLHVLPPSDPTPVAA